MNALMQRMKSGLRRVGDWITGRDIEVGADLPQAELLESRRTLRPAMDVFENASELLLVADVPGAQRDTTWVSVDDGRLTLLAAVNDRSEARSLFGDHMDADWYGHFALPEGIDEERIEASMKRGVVTLRLPKRPRPAPRRIAVRSAS